MLGAAKTGSGKTLAFLVPLVEKLNRELFSRDHGIGAVVISPTQELATQTYKTLVEVASEHEVCYTRANTHTDTHRQTDGQTDRHTHTHTLIFRLQMSCGLFTGGNNVKIEKKMAATRNIVVATPGRLVQHMDETANFNFDNLQVWSSTWSSCRRALRKLLLKLQTVPPFLFPPLLTSLHPTPLPLSRAISHTLSFAAMYIMCMVAADACAGRG